MIRSSSTEDIVKKLQEDIQIKTKLISAYKIPTPEFEKLIPNEYFTLEIKKFLILKALSKDITTNPTLKPSRALDDLWIKFMTCINEYIKFCNSILPEEDCGNMFIEKIEYHDERNKENGFEKTIEEYRQHFSQDMLSTVLWNPRYKEKTYDELKIIVTNSPGNVYHSPLYESKQEHSVKFNRYADTFNPPSPVVIIDSMNRQASKSEINLDSEAKKMTAPKVAPHINDISSPPNRARSNSIMPIGNDDSNTKSSPPSRARSNSATSIENDDSGKKKRGRPSKNNGLSTHSSEKKKKGRKIRYEKCSTCNDAVGEDNHANIVAVYIDDLNHETRGGHVGKCRKKVAP